MNGTFEIDNEAKLVKVCGWCYPGNSAWALEELKPALLAGYSLSHGICKPHANAVKIQAVKAMLNTPVTSRV